MIDVDRGPRPPELDDGYSSSAFREVLCARFLGKCYLTEAPISPGSLDVEHRVPKGDGGDDAWENLFPAHPKANSHRRRKLPDGGLLSPGDGVERRLVQKLERDAESVRCLFHAADSGDLPAKNAAAELTRLHHEVAPWSDELRRAIHARYTEVLEQVVAFLTGDPAAAVRLRLLLSRRAPYTALLRSAMGPEVAALYDDP